MILKVLKNEIMIELQNKFLDLSFPRPRWAILTPSMVIHPLADSIILKIIDI